MASIPGSSADSRTDDRDWIVVEEPLELRTGGASWAVIMRTPGHDRELVRGLLFAEGIIDHHEALATMAEPDGLSRHERGNVLEVGAVLSAEHGQPAARALPSTASCGVCGKRSIAELELRAAPVRSGLGITAATIAALPDRLRQAQELFDTTGGLHAAGAFTATGELLCVREDVGRHNAVDKLVGWALTNGRIPASELALCVSGRLGFEIVQKAVMAGFPIIVAVSAPSSLAVAVAERFRVTLCGFTRRGRFNVYTHPTRVR